MAYTQGSEAVGCYRMSKLTAHKFSNKQYLISRYANKEHLEEVISFIVFEDFRATPNIGGYRAETSKVITLEMVDQIHALSKFIPVKDAIFQVLNSN